MSLPHAAHAQPCAEVYDPAAAATASLVYSAAPCTSNVSLPWSITDMCLCMHYAYLSR
jgi:hypothetical protein